MFVNKNIYEKIRTSIPINAVELLIYNSKGEILIFKRANEPAKNQWWLPGGRVMLGEKRLEALSRLINDECGIKDYKIISDEVIEYSVSDSRKVICQHVISTIYKIYVKDIEVISDYQTLEFKWVRSNEFKTIRLHKFMDYILDNITKVDMPSFIDLSLSNKNNYIDDELYNIILEKFPIPCVDILIKNENGEILLVKRKNEPAKNEWWVPGGRVYHGEKRLDTAKRKLKEECGLVGTNYKIIMVKDFIFKGERIIHDIGTIFSANLLKGNINLDEQSSDAKWLKPEQWLEVGVSNFIANLLTVKTK